MAFHNINYKSKLLSPGTYTTGDLGNGLTASTVHEVFCLTSGDITITPLGGGDRFTWSATAGQSMKVVVGNCTVAGGAEFVGFKSDHQNGNRLSQQRPNS